MIISHSRNYIFVATPKVASQSIRRALRGSLTEIDWEQCGYFERKRIPIPHLAILATGHLSLSQLQPFLEVGQWHEYFKFAFVREPMDRFLSACFFRNRELYKCADINAALRVILDAQPHLDTLHFKPQHSFVYKDDSCLADYIGYYENLGDHLNHIRHRLVIQAEDLPVLNVTSHRPRHFKPASDIIDRVVTIYADDYRLFDYPYP